MKSSRVNTSKIVVIGNGPSLRGFDFHVLSGIDSLGMNAAYRHWERINWFPTHYACLDDQLIETHADAIFELIESGKVRTAFLVAKILDFYPGLRSRDNVFFLESFNKTRQGRVAHLGIPFIPSTSFRESDPSKVTTGAYAMRYAAHLGYGEMTVIGVDLRYVEVIPEAEHGDGIKLVMTTTPEHNPNYFFDDYQRAGDKFNVPNPAVHERGLHAAAFEALMNDIVQFRWQTRVFNSNLKSLLHEQAILPYVDIDQFAHGRDLAAVVIPTTRAEEKILLGNIRLWDMPQFFPSISPSAVRRPDLIFAFSSAEDAQIRSRLIAAVQATRYLSTCFERVKVIFIGLSESLDYYERDYTRKASGRGHKSGPNEQFFETISKLRGVGNYIFYMESDCLPLRQGWLDRLQSLAAGDNESWIVGSVYRGIASISARFLLHLNGNALYRIGDKGFCDFAELQWRPLLNREVDFFDQRMAYDCMLSHVLTLADPDSRNTSWIMFQSLAHRFRATALIQNISGDADQRKDPLDVLSRILIEQPETYLIHGRQFVNFLQGQLPPSADASAPNLTWAGRVRPPRRRGADPAIDLDRLQAQQPERLPRLLIIDGTAAGSRSATGQIKKVFLEGWPAERLLQVYESAGVLRLKRFAVVDGAATTEADRDVAAACRSFDPEVVYFRPLDSEVLMTFAESYLRRSGKPFALHIMDDWPERLRVQDPSRYKTINGMLTDFIARAGVRLGIGESMCAAFGARYGVEFKPLANGIDVDQVQHKDWDARLAMSSSHPFTIRYMGGLAKDMTSQSVFDVARVVSDLSKSRPVRMEIFTMDWYLADARRAVQHLQNVSVASLVPEDEYAECLASADALLVAYNFDDTSLRYIRHSLANKLPECLATGVPLIAYGPRAAATIRYIEEAACACIVTEQQDTLLREAIEVMVREPTRARELGNAGRRFARQHLDRRQVVAAFRMAMLSTAHSPKSDGVGPPQLPARLPAAQVETFNGPALFARPERVTTSGQVSEVTASSWRWSVAEEYGRKVWMGTVGKVAVSPGTAFTGRLQIRVSDDTAVSFSFGRHGSEAFEGTGAIFDLKGGKTYDVQLMKPFTAPHHSLKIQAEFLRTSASTHLEAEITDVYLSETVTSWIERDRQPTVSFSDANRLLRQGSPASALWIYLRLYRNEPLELFAGSALLAYRKACFGPAESINAMLRKLDPTRHSSIVRVADSTAI